MQGTSLQLHLCLARGRWAPRTGQTEKRQKEKEYGWNFAIWTNTYFAGRAVFRRTQSSWGRNRRHSAQPWPEVRHSWVSRTSPTPDTPASNHLTPSPFAQQTQVIVQGDSEGHNFKKQTYLLKCLGNLNMPKKKLFMNIANGLNSVFAEFI